ncbi:MAG: HAMP domain-containing histidine kinase [Deltaproteobacteria bacterium]|nr:HAMP domain-containing histidine kinase [Deltaproteobacteria bacterium]
MSHGNTGREGAVIARIVLRPSLPLLALAGLACAVISVFRLVETRAVLGLIASLALVFTVQAFLILWRSTRLGARLSKTPAGDQAAIDELLRSFPISVTLQLTAAMALFGPTGLIVATGALDLSPEQLLWKSVAAFFLSETVFLVPIYLVMRNGMQTASDTLQLRVKHRCPTSLGLLITIILPAILVAFGLILESERIVTEMSREWEAESYRQAAEAALSEVSRPSDISALSDFDRLVSFVFHPDGRNKIEGIRISPPGNHHLVVLMLLAILGAILASAAFALRRSSWIGTQFSLLSKRIELLPDSETKTTHEDMAVELRDVNSCLSELKKRFSVMRATTKEALETCREARDLKSQFFAGMSHDLRSPLNSVIGFTDLLLKGMEGPMTEKQRQGVLQIAGDAEKLMVLVADILDTSKLEAGRFELNRSWVPSVEVLTECSSVIKRLTETQPVELHTTLQPGLPPVYVDKHRISQAIVSLLAKVITAVRKGRVVMKASLDKSVDGNGRALSLVIADPDRAIEQSEKERFREAFHSIEGTASHSNAGGMVLGITLARDIVRLHDGELEVVSDENTSTVFKVSIPLDESTQTE